MTQSPTRHRFGLPAVVGLAQVGILLSYMGLGLLGHGSTRPQGGTLALLLLPVLAVLPGLWLQRYSALVWAALVDMFYLAAAITDFWSPGTDRGWNGAIIALALVGFIAAWWHSLRMRRERKRLNRST